MANERSVIFGQLTWLIAQEGFINLFSFAFERSTCDACVALDVCREDVPWRKRIHHTSLWTCSRSSRPACRQWTGHVWRKLMRSPVRETQKEIN
jgi:hypothetical protein